jgi:hypothetical protein
LQLRPRSSSESGLEIKPGDVIIDSKKGHAMIYTGGKYAVTHAAQGGTVAAVISQQTSSFARNAAAEDKKPEDLAVFRLSGASQSTPATAAQIAKRFASDTGGPGKKDISEATRYSEDRLDDVYVAESTKWTQASAFRAVRAALRSQEQQYVPLSNNKGTTCASFVETSMQAAVVRQAMAEDKLPPEAKNAIERIKDEGLHRPGQAKAMKGSDKTQRYQSISETASNQIKDLMPEGLQHNAKTMNQASLAWKWELPNSGFEKVGYANPQGDRIEVLPENHTELETPVSKLRRSDGSGGSIN